MKMIWVTFQKEGIHCYPNAPEEVIFLRNPHRHMFHFKVSLEVMHNDRDVEFIMFKRELEGLFAPFSSGFEIHLELDNKSCEMLADEIAEYLLANYPGRRYTVEVSEDNENGAILYS